MRRRRRSTGPAQHFARRSANSEKEIGSGGAAARPRLAAMSASRAAQHTERMGIIQNARFLSRQARGLCARYAAVSRHSVFGRSRPNYDLRRLVGGLPRLQYAFGFRLSTVWFCSAPT
jgi:hypothetical protein